MPGSGTREMWPQPRLGQWAQILLKGRLLKRLPILRPGTRKIKTKLKNSAHKEKQESLSSGNLGWERKAPGRNWNCSPFIWDSNLHYPQDSEIPRLKAIMIFFSCAIGITGILIEANDKWLCGMKNHPIEHKFTIKKFKTREEIDHNKESQQMQQRKN